MPNRFEVFIKNEYFCPQNTINNVYKIDLFYF